MPPCTRAKSGFGSRVIHPLETNAPRVVAPATRLEDLLFLAAEPDPSAHCDLLEWRLDGLLNDGAEATQLLELAGQIKLPVLLTPRARREGGVREWSVRDRAAAVDQVRQPGMWIDIEAADAREEEMAEHVARWIAGAHPLVFSAHDFIGIPDSNRLSEIENTAAAAGASVFKIAATPADLSALLGMAQWFAGNHPLPVAAMAMGRFGMASRLLFAQAGSVLNYGYLRSATVPGQWQAATLKKLLTPGS